MPLIARQRPRLAVLAVLALVGSLLAISAVPAVAVQDEKASAVAEFSACVEDATEDAAFTDMEGNSAQDDANCLFHYGITTGTGKDPLTYGPNDRSLVARWLCSWKGLPARRGSNWVTPKIRGSLTSLARATRSRTP